MTIHAKMIICLAMAVSVGLAAPVLCAVFLPDNAAIQEWVSMEIPTYEFINRNAIAEVDDAMIAVLRQKGYRIDVIDATPWDKDYYLAGIPSGGADAIGDMIRWQSGRHCLVEVGDADIMAARSLPVVYQPLYRKSLPQRYWRQWIDHMVFMPLDYDPFIQSIVDQVNSDTIMSFVQRLEDYKTRLTHSDSSFAASQWMFDKFAAWGCTPAFDSFYVDSNMAAWGYWPDTGYERNVVATINGSMDPATQMIICGHHDAIIWWDTSLARTHAPGADDNASGAVAAMEAARIFSNYSWEPTVKFITWATEELGLYGSYHYADKADSLGWKIGGVVNGDMIGYMDDGNNDSDIQRKDSLSLWFSDLFVQAGALYVPQLSIIPRTSTGGSDWYPFAVAGYPSVGACEHAGSQWNPYYHDTTDKTTTITPAFFVLVTKAEIAALAILATYPGIVEDVVVRDMGNGTDLEVSWSQCPASDITGYRIYLGRQSQAYSDTFAVSGATTVSDTLTGLMSDSTYYVAVTALDADDHESYAANEKTGVPRLIPLPPSGVTATPIIAGIRLDWHPNQEVDFAGYRVYRRINENPTWDSLNTILLPDTNFTNAPLSGANRYYYALRAFDDQGNASPMSNEAYGRPVTLDQGILVVDETRNGGGPNPPDSLQNQFYEYALQDYPFTEYEFGNETQRPVLADLVPYSTVAWFADDYSQLMAADNVPDLIAYLEYGGNLWFAGWKATANLMDNTMYPATYGAGDFVRDYMYVGEVAISSSSDTFATAVGHAGYPDLDVDTARVYGGILYMIEAYLYSSPGEEIYTIHMQNNSSPYEGLTCGIRYLGANHRIVLMGLPYYYMAMDDARAVAQKVMSDFGEVGIAEIDKGLGSIRASMLYQNIPNPFTDRTMITFQVPGRSAVRLGVYNVLGQRIRTLVQGMKDPGLFSLDWDGCDDRGRSVASGIYFCKLEVDDDILIRKMIVVR